MKKVAVITPTYNRGALLGELYKSLKKQTSKKFKWIIIDDGSIDNTREIIQSFIKELIIDIEYHYIKNGGKHRALNKAINLCQEELFFIVDSDDVLTENAIEEIISMESSLINKEEYAGIAGMKAGFDKKLLSNSLEKEVIDATSIEDFYNLNLKGDKAEVFYTDVLKKYSFPEFEGEKFITEAVVWHKIANDGYKMRWFNKIIYLAEYRNDGLTKRALELSLSNPKGKAFFHNQESEFDIPIRWKIYHGANYFRYGILSKYEVKKLWKESKLTNFRWILLLLGIVVNLYTKFKVKFKRG